MPQTVTLGTRVPIAFRDRVDDLARALRRDRAWIVEEAVRLYLDEQHEFIAAVQRGREDIAAGRFVTHAELDAELDRIEAELRGGQPGTQG